MARKATTKRASRAKRSTRRSGGADKLRVYREKRDFGVTPEPSGDAPRAAKPKPGASFVVQKHAARRLHYDFRLELDGVLLSWSVPKGPSMVAGDRRLAVQTEDHPLDYADFEGIIPQGEYGGGTVVVWDRGSWTPDGDAREAMKKGKLTFTLEGEKLRGRFHLVRTRFDGGKPNWLLFKGRDAAAVASGEIVEERPESVITGRTIEAVAAARDRVWHSNRPKQETPISRVRRLAGRSSGTRPVERPAAPAASLHALVAQLPQDIPFTNLDKVLYPEQGLTKVQLIAYFAVVSEWILPHVGKRPLTLVRCPDGHTKQCFFQKHASLGMPRSIRRVPIAEDDGEVKEYLQIDDLAGLVATAQLGALELHTWGAHADKPERPDLIVFDLDPDTGLGWDDIVAAAFDMRDRLSRLGLESWVKTTGGKGLHVVAPIARRVEWDAFKAFTRAVAEQMAAEEPTRYTSNPLKSRRAGKIFVDYLRNGRGATFIAPYSPRRRAGAPVAVPITWDELSAGIEPAKFTVTTVPQRLGALGGDPWRGMAEVEQTIGAAARRAVGL